MEKKLRIAMFGQKRLSREGGIEIVVRKLGSRMAAKGHRVTYYNRSGHHVSGVKYDHTDTACAGVRQKSVLTIEKKGLAAVSSSYITPPTEYLRLDMVSSTNPSRIFPGIRFSFGRE